MIKSDTSSALLTVSFDWSNSSVTGKETSEQEAYKYDTRRLAQVDGEETDYPYDVIATKLRVRGRGKVARIRYTSSPGKDFRLLGYALLGISRTESESNK